MIALSATSALACAHAPTPPRPGLPPPLRIAVLPIENLTGAAAPLREMLPAVRLAFTRENLDVVDANLVERFLADKRLRYTGGIDRASAKSAAQALGADAVLVTSLRTFRPADPPKLGVTMRLVRANEEAVVLWADGVSRAGDDSPGLLGLGSIDSLPTLQEKVLADLARSLRTFTAGRGAGSSGCGAAARFNPKVHYRAPGLGAAQSYSVAVVPFLNGTPQRRAGEVAALEFVRQLATTPNFRVIEPGVVRDVLLRYRVVIPGGVSLETARELLGALEADLVLSGTVLEYEDLGGRLGPRVRFGAVLLDGHTGKVVWQSTSYSQGSDGTFLFDIGSVATGGELLCRMVAGVMRQLAGPGAPEAESLGRRSPGEEWAVSRITRAGAMPPPEPLFAACTVPLPVGAVEVSADQVRPELAWEGPGGAATVKPLRAIAVHYDTPAASSSPADHDALVALARCAREDGHTLFVRATAPATDAEMAEAARRGADVQRLSASERLFPERVTVQVLSSAEKAPGVDLVVAVLPGLGPSAPTEGKPREPQQSSAAEEQLEAQLEDRLDERLESKLTEALQPKPAPPAVAAKQGPEALLPGEAGRRQMVGAVEAVRADLRRCLEAEAKRAPGATAPQGDVRVSIDPSGRVVRADLSDEAQRHTPFDACVQAAAKLWPFPATGGDYSLHVPMKDARKDSNR